MDTSNHIIISGVEEPHSETPRGGRIIIFLNIETIMDNYCFLFEEHSSCFLSVLRFEIVVRQPNLDPLLAVRSSEMYLM